MDSRYVDPLSGLNQDGYSPVLALRRMFHRACIAGLCVSAAGVGVDSCSCSSFWYASVMLAKRCELSAHPGLTSGCSDFASSRYRDLTAGVSADAGRSRSARRRRRSILWRARLQRGRSHRPWVVRGLVSGPGLILWPPCFPGVGCAGAASRNRQHTRTHVQASDTSKFADTDRLEDLPLATCARQLSMAGRSLRRVTRHTPKAASGPC
jgi:hypothetical protein